MAGIWEVRIGTEIMYSDAKGLGIDSVMAPKALRLEAWRRIGSDLDHRKLGALTTTIGFDGIIDTAKAIVDGKVRGRVVVDMTR